MLTENAHGFEAAGRNRGCLAGWMSSAGCAGTSTAWPALENILRKAIRHSPPDGIVSLSGQREGDMGICGSTIRAAGWRLKNWSGFLRPLPADFDGRALGMAALAWA